MEVFQDVKLTRFYFFGRELKLNGFPYPYHDIYYNAAVVIALDKNMIYFRQLHQRRDGNVKRWQGKFRGEAEEVEAVQGAVEDVEVEVRAVGKAGGVGCQPATEGGIVVPLAEEDEPLVGTLGAKAPGAELGSTRLSAKSIEVIGLNKLA